MKSFFVVDGNHYLRSAIKFEEANTLIQEIENDKEYISLSNNLINTGITIQFSIDHSQRSLSCYFGYELLKNKHFYDSETCTLEIRNQASEVFDKLELKLKPILNQYGFVFYKSGIIISNSN